MVFPRVTTAPAAGAAQGKHGPEERFRQGTELTSTRQVYSKAPVSRASPGRPVCLLLTAAQAGDHEGLAHTIYPFGLYNLHVITVPGSRQLHEHGSPDPSQGGRRRPLPVTNRAGQPFFGVGLA